MFLEISHNSQGNTCARVSFLIKLQLCSFIKKEALTQVFSCEVCEISKNTLLQNTSEQLLLKSENWFSSHDISVSRNDILLLPFYFAVNFIFSWREFKQFKTNLRYSSFSKSTKTSCKYLPLEMSYMKNDNFTTNLLKQGTTWNHLKSPEVTTWGY